MNTLRRMWGRLLNFRVGQKRIPANPAMLVEIIQVSLRYQKPLMFVSDDAILSFAHHAIERRLTYRDFICELKGFIAGIKAANDDEP